MRTHTNTNVHARTHLGRGLDGGLARLLLRARKVCAYTGDTARAHAHAHTLGIGGGGGAFAASTTSYDTLTSVCSHRTRTTSTPSRTPRTHLLVDDGSSSRHWRVCSDAQHLAARLAVGAIVQLDDRRIAVLCVRCAVQRTRSYVSHRAHVITLQRKCITPHHVPWHR
jgi:hypothetical protein